MDYVTPKQLNFVLTLEPRLAKSKLSKTEKAFLQDVIRRVKEFGLKTVLSKYEQDKISRIVKYI